MTNSDNQNHILLALADIYYSMHLINLKENTVAEYSARKDK